MAEVLLAGIQEDFENIIYKYSVLKCYDFTNFVKVWNEMKFYYIYCGRPSELEMKFFTQNVLIIAKNMILKGATEWESLAALYLLHALYFLQPLQKPVEIRITHEEMKELFEFVNYAKTKSDDAIYAFMKLIFDNAFHCVYSESPKTIEKAGRADLSMLSTFDETDVKEQRKGVFGLIKQGRIDETKWRGLEKDYNKSLKLISSMNVGEKEFHFTPSDFFKDILFPPRGCNDGGESSQSRTPLVPRRKKRLLQMMTNGLKSEDEMEDEDAHPDGESLPLLDVSDSS